MRQREREQMNILPSLWQPLIDISWMRLKSPRTGSASKLARVLHLQLFFATCKLPACHASKLTLPFVWSPVSKRLLSPGCQSEHSALLQRHKSCGTLLTAPPPLKSNSRSQCVSESGKGICCLSVSVFVLLQSYVKACCEAVCFHIHNTLRYGAHMDGKVWIELATCSNHIHHFFP